MHRETSRAPACSSPSANLADQAQGGAYSARLQATGSSLRSRRDERYLRRFVQGAAVSLIDGSIEDVGERLGLVIGELGGEPRAAQGLESGIGHVVTPGSSG